MDKNLEESKTNKEQSNVLQGKLLLIIGLAVIALQLAATVVFMANLHTVNVLPFDYKLLVGILLGLFVAITAITQRWKIPGMVTKVLGFLLSVILIVGSVYINITYKALSNMSGVSTNTTVVNVYVLKDNPADDIDDILDQKIGILTTLDRTHTDMTVETIEKEHKATLTLEEYDALMDLAAALYDGTVQAIILNEGYVGVISGFEGFQGFEEETRVLKSVKKEEQIDVGPIVGPNGSQNPLLHSEDGHVICLYISGVDVPGSPAVSRNSDVNILCFINKKTKEILLLNTPRDYYLIVQMDGGHMDKLTHAGCYGVDCSIATLEQFYGVDIDHYAKVNFTGFQQIIDSLGGVRVWSEYEFTSYHGNYHFVRGHNDMNGAQALGFCRERYSFPSGDNQRGRNQMEVIKAIIMKMESSDMLLNYQAVLQSISSSMVTSMSYEEITDLVQFQLNENPQWKIKNFAVWGQGDNQYCYNLGAANYVMWPNEDAVNEAKALMQAIYEDRPVN